MSEETGAQVLASEEECIGVKLFLTVGDGRKITGRGRSIIVYDPNTTMNTPPYWEHHSTTVDATVAFGFSCAIAMTILKDKAVVESYTKKSRQLLSEQYSLATKVLDKAGIDYVRNGNAGFFFWIYLSSYLSFRNPDSAGWAAEKELKTKLSEAGVEISSGLAYKAERLGWFRAIFSVERDILEQGLRRIIQTCIERKSVTVTGGTA